jgi:hypothetical protein
MPQVQQPYQFNFVQAQQQQYQQQYQQLQSQQQQFQQQQLQYQQQQLQYQQLQQMQYQQLQNQQMQQQQQQQQQQYQQSVSTLASMLTPPAPGFFGSLPQLSFLTPQLLHHQQQQQQNVSAPVQPSVVQRGEEDEDEDDDEDVVPGTRRTLPPVARRERSAPLSGTKKKKPASTRQQSRTARASAFVIPRTNGYAGSSDPHQVDTLLVAEGWRPFAQMTNQFVLEKVGEHSPEGHLLTGFMDPVVREGIKAKIIAARRPVDPETGCEPSRQATITPIHGSCEECGERMSGKLGTSRALAIINEPIEHAWMGVVTKRVSNPKAPIFQGSARCDKWQRDQHCLNKDHVFLETAKQNQKRRTHHLGEHGCFCELPCMGDKVVHELTWKDTGAGR